MKSLTGKMTRFAFDWMIANCPDLKPIKEDEHCLYYEIHGDLLIAKKNSFDDIVVSGTRFDSYREEEDYREMQGRTKDRMKKSRGIK